MSKRNNSKLELDLRQALVYGLIFELGYHWDDTHKTQHNKKVRKEILDKMTGEHGYSLGASKSAFGRAMLQILKEKRGY